MAAPPSERSAERARVQAFTEARVLVLGDLVADHYVFGQTDRVSREAPVLIVRYEASEVKLGGAANAAANVRSLGGKVVTLGVLGEDEMGAALQAAFAQSDIAFRGLTRPTLMTETKMRILAGGLNTTRQQMLRVDRGNRPPLSLEVQRELEARLRDEAPRADAILVSDYGSGVVNDLTRTALAELSAAGMTVCVDSRYGLRDFRRATACKPNEPELEALTGLTIRSEASLREAAHRALELLACDALLVTRGRSGMALFEASGAEEILPVHGAAEAVDVTGAGDTVIATFTLALAAGASKGEAARLANVAGALVVQKQGTATVSASELSDALGATLART